MNDVIGWDLAVLAVVESGFAESKQFSAAAGVVSSVATGGALSPVLVEVGAEGGVGGTRGGSVSLSSSVSPRVWLAASTGVPAILRAALHGVILLNDSLELLNR